MFGKSLRALFGLGAVMLTLAAVANAQSTQVDGTVKVKNEDGTIKPVAGALVDIYRTDIRGKFDVKTDKNGHYIRLGIPIQGIYTFAFSGPGCHPTWIPNVKVSLQPTVDIVLDPGDGSTITLEQIQQAGSQQKTAGTKPAATQPSAGDKAKAEQEKKEYDAKVKESQELQANFDQARQHYNTGVELMKATNYPGALSEFEQASTVDPSKHAAMLMLAYRANANLAEAHYQIGVSLFNEKKRPEAKAHFEAAVEAAKRAITNIGNEKTENNANINNDVVTYYNILVKNVSLLVEHYGAAELVDDTVKALDKAEALDAANKNKWELQKAYLYRWSKPDDAVTVYKSILAADPKNIEALYNMGLTLLGSPEKEKIQESINTLAAFVDAAPATDKRVPDVKNTIAAIKEQYKIEAEKPAKRGKRP